VVHFKELFLLDGKPADLSENDTGRRNTICRLLEEWGLLRVVDPESIQTPSAPLSQIKIVSHKEKNDWQLVAKYTIGKRKRVE